MEYQTTDAYSSALQSPSSFSYYDRKRPGLIASAALLRERGR